MLAANRKYGSRAARRRVAPSQRWTIGPLAASAKKGSPAVTASTASSHGIGLPASGGVTSGTPIGSATAAITSTAICMSA